MNSKSIRLSLLFFAVFVCIGMYSFSAVQDHIAFAKSVLVKQTSSLILEALFSPTKDDYNAKDVLLGLIKNEKKRILIALYVITDSTIAKALCDACARGIRIVMVVDKESLKYKNEQISKLKKGGIKVLVYEGNWSIMHNKFYLFENNFFNRSILWTGSANASPFAFGRNWENILVLNDLRCIKRYTERFAKLLKEVTKCERAKQD